jgi:hypothetical protein
MATLADDNKNSLPLDTEGSVAKIMGTDGVDMDAPAKIETPPVKKIQKKLPEKINFEDRDISPLQVNKYNE